MKLNRVQEVGAADTVEMQVGSVAMGWRYIVRTIYYLHFVRNIPVENIERSDSCCFPVHSNLTIFKPLLIIPTSLTGLEKIRLGWNQRKRQSLRDLVRECRYRKATDPRDKIYSLLGLMGDRMNEYLKPDYTKSVGEVRLFQSPSLHAMIDLHRHIQIQHGTS